jgi:succinate dehydrogenase / fumarate reductase flavoprotein subunit
MLRPDGKKKTNRIEEDRDYYLERRYPFWDPSDVASRAAKERSDGFENKTGEAVYLDFAAAIQRYGTGIHKRIR